MCAMTLLLISMVLTCTQENMVEGGNARLSREERIRRLQALAGQYIALAYAVQPAKEMYMASLRRSEVCVYECG